MQFSLLTLLLASTAPSFISAAPSFPTATTPSTCTGTTFYGAYRTTMRSVVTQDGTSSTSYSESTVQTRWGWPYYCYTREIYIPTEGLHDCWSDKPCATPEPECTTTSTYYEPCYDPCCPTTTTYIRPACSPKCRTTECYTEQVHLPQTRNCSYGNAPNSGPVITITTIPPPLSSRDPGDRHPGRIYFFTTYTNGTTHVGPTAGTAA